MDAMQVPGPGEYTAEYQALGGKPRKKRRGEWSLSDVFGGNRHSGRRKAKGSAKHRKAKAKAAKIARRANR